MVAPGGDKQQPYSYREHSQCSVLAYRAQEPVFVGYVDRLLELVIRNVRYVLAQLLPAYVSCHTYSEFTAVK